MKKLTTLILLTISLNLLSQVPVTNIAVKESNVQGWAEVEWQKITNTSIAVFDTYLQILSVDTLTIVYNSKPMEHQDKIFFTDGTIVNTGEMLRLKFIFDESGLNQIYFLTVPKTSGYYISKQMVISIDGKAHLIEQLNTKTTHWDIVMELGPNDYLEY